MQGMTSQDRWTWESTPARARPVQWLQQAGAGRLTASARIRPLAPRDPTRASAVARWAAAKAISHALAAASSAGLRRHKPQLRVGASQVRRCRVPDAPARVQLSVCWQKCGWHQGPGSCCSGRWPRHAAQVPEGIKGVGPKLQAALEVRGLHLATACWKASRMPLTPSSRMYRQYQASTAGAGVAAQACP